MNRFRVLFAVFAFAATTLVQAQTSADKFIDFRVAPALGFRVMGNVNIPSSYKGTRSDFLDSLKKADRPGQSLNFGVQYLFKQNAFDALSFGLSYTTLSFRRVRENLKIGDLIHPDVGYIIGVIQAANLKVKYDYRYSYLEASMLWHKSAEGYKKKKELDLWWVYGFSPAVLIRDNVHIFTEGFTMNGSNQFNVKDKEATPFRFNVYGQAAFRVQTYLYKKVHGLFQPRLRVPLLPSSTGSQTVWIPQFSIDLGLVYLIDDKR